MQTYRLLSGAGTGGLQQVEAVSKPLDAREVRIEMQASALNFRDLDVAKGQYGSARGTEMVPLSDGVGTIVETGALAKRFARGDRVIPTFWPNWIDGESSPDGASRSFGVEIDGTLTQVMVAPEEALVRAPTTVSGSAAASIACAGVTAWNALFVRGQLKPGSSVLILGTGSVAIWALQLATAAGMKAIVTSSSDDKLQRAEQLGARGLVNYRKNPEWQTEVLAQTQGKGVDLVLEVGGQDTLLRSVAAARFGGRVVVIGGLSGWGGADLSPNLLIGGNKTVEGIMVGSRRMTEDLVRFIDTAKIVPVIDSEFAFAEARDAYERLESGQAFGKVIIRA